MNDERFNQLLKGQPATLAEFKELYDTTVSDLRHAVRYKDERDIEAVTKAFEGWLRTILSNVPDKTSEAEK